MTKSFSTSYFISLYQKSISYSKKNVTFTLSSLSSAKYLILQFHVLILLVYDWDINNYFFLQNFREFQLVWGGWWQALIRAGLTAAGQFRVRLGLFPTQTPQPIRADCSSAGSKMCSSQQETFTDFNTSWVTLHNDTHYSGSSTLWKDHGAFLKSSGSAFYFIGQFDAVVWEVHINHSKQSQTAWCLHIYQFPMSHLKTKNTVNLSNTLSLLTTSRNSFTVLYWIYLYILWFKDL